MPFPVRPAPLRHLLGGDRAVDGAPVRAQEEPGAPPPALTAGPPPDDPRTDLVRRNSGVRAGLDDQRHPTLVVQGRPVPRVVEPTTHRRARPTPARPARRSPAPDASASRPARRALRSQPTHPPRGLLQIPGSPPRWIRRGWTIQGRLSWSFRAPQRRLHSAARWRHHPRRWRGPVTALVADPVDGSAQVPGGVGMDDDNLTRVDPDAEDRVRLVAQRPAQAVEDIGVHRSTLPFRSPTRPRGPSRESRSSGGWR